MDQTHNVEDSIPTVSSLKQSALSISFLSDIDVLFLQVDSTTGRMTGASTTYAICGGIRRMVCVLCYLQTGLKKFVLVIFINVLIHINVLKINFVM